MTITDKIRNSRVGIALAALTLPFLAAFPWMGLMTSPLAEEVIVRRQVTSYAWMLLAFSYIVYLVGGKRVKSIFSVFTIASIAAFITSVVLRRISEKTCVPFCFGLIAKQLGLACGYMDDSCELENFVMAFALTVLAIALYRIKKQRH